MLSAHQQPENFDPYSEHGFLCGQDQKEAKSSRVSDVLRSVAESHRYYMMSSRILLHPSRRHRRIRLLLTHPNGRNCPYLSKKARESVRLKHKRWQKYIYCKTEQNLNLYKRARNNATSENKNLTV